MPFVALRARPRRVRLYFSTGRVYDAKRGHDMRGPRGYPALAAFLLVACAPTLSWGQVSVLGARSAALGGATTALAGDVWAQANPAAWGHASDLSLAAHGAQLYGMPELRYAGAMLVVPIARTAVAVGASTFGFALYRSTTIDAGLAGLFEAGTYRRISFGLRSRWRAVKFARYGRTDAWSLTAGLQLPVTPFMTLGATVHNVVVRAGRSRSDVPRRLEIGLAYHGADNFALTADVGKEVRSPVSVASGVEIGLVPAFFLRGGVTSSPRRVGGGIGVRVRQLAADIAAVRHEALGWSPSLSVLLSW